MELQAKELCFYLFRQSCVFFTWRTEFTMDKNMRTRAMMARLELLIEECIVEEEDKAKWLACIPKFREGMIKLRSKEDFEGDAVAAFQKDTDKFFQLWVELWGLEGVTNYIHMMPFFTWRTKFTMDKNMRTRAMMARLELLMEEYIVEEEDKAKWLACIPKFRDGMIKLRSKEDFEGDAVAAFQKDTDKFFQLWVELWGLEGVTNYIHMMPSGHLTTYLFKWKNLCQHSQQGWEAFNSLVKTFYLRQTQHGGRSNAGRGQKSRLLPIGRWLQRRVVWLCHEGPFIEEWNKQNPGAPRSGVVGEGEAEEEEDICTGAEGIMQMLEQ
jgi:hypothetical protein